MVGDIIARYPLEVDSPLQSPEQGYSLPNVQAQRQYVMRFDVLDVIQDEHLELLREVAKSGTQIVHLAATRSAHDARLGRDVCAPTGGFS